MSAKPDKFGRTDAAPSVKEAGMARFALFGAVLGVAIQYGSLLVPILANLWFVPLLIGLLACISAKARARSFKAANAWLLLVAVLNLVTQVIISRETTGFLSPKMIDDRYYLLDHGQKRRELTHAEFLRAEATSRGIHAAVGVLLCVIALGLHRARDDEKSPN